MIRSVPFAAILAAAVAAGCGGGGGAPAPGSQKAGAAAGKAAPDFALPEVGGQVVHMSDFQGKVRLVDFWTTWCAPCREEIPMFKDLQATYGPRGFAILGIAMDEEGGSVVKPFVADNAIDYVTLLGDDAVAKAYGPIVGFPTKFLVDREGRIVESFVGPVPRAVLEKKIEALL